MHMYAKLNQSSFLIIMTLIATDKSNLNKFLLKLVLRVDASRNHSSTTAISWDINAHPLPFIFLTTWHGVPLHFTNYQDGQSDNL